MSVSLPSLFSIITTFEALRFRVGHPCQLLLACAVLGAHQQYQIGGCKIKSVFSRVLGRNQVPASEGLDSCSKRRSLVALPFVKSGPGNLEWPLLDRFLSMYRSARLPQYPSAADSRARPVLLAISAMVHSLVVWSAHDSPVFTRRFTPHYVFVPPPTNPHITASYCPQIFGR